MTALQKAIDKASEAEMGKVAYAIHQLMDRPKVPFAIGKKKVKLHPEQKLSVEVADEFRRLTKEYQKTGKGLRAVWFHNANERECGWFTAILLRAMGMLPGAQDYCFIWENGGGLIEIKVDGDLSKFQEYFNTWALSVKANKAVLRSVPAVIETLTAWGAIV